MSTPSPRPVGIERIAAYPCTLAIDMETLAHGRDHDPKHPIEELLVTARSLNPLWEDPVTMAVNAARTLLTEEDRAEIELIVVGTESSPDFGKPISTYVQRWCGIQPNCRNFETKHACYGGTAALMTAAHWVASGVRPGKKALVITTDQSRAHLGKPWEYVLGAGASAMIVSDQPDVLALNLTQHGYWTTEIADTFRPSPAHEEGNVHESLYAYLDALEGAYAHFESQVGEIDYRTWFKRNIYHVPFGGMTFQAHRTLLKRSGRISAREVREHFDHQTRPTLRYTSQMGGTYTSAVYLALMSLVRSCGDELAAGDRIGVLSYGSGSCAEFFAPRIGANAANGVLSAELETAIAERQMVDLAEYERLERNRTALCAESSYRVDLTECDGLYQRNYADRRRLYLREVAGWTRHYELS